MENQELSLFHIEEAILSEAKAALEPDGANEGQFRERFASLISQYEKLFRHVRYLVKLSDRMQKDLNDLNERLAESEEKYRSIFENVGEGLFRMSIDGTFIDVNPAMITILGYSSPDDFIEQVNSRNIPLFPDANEQSRLITAVIDNGSVNGLQVQMQKKDRTPIWVEIKAHINLYSKYRGMSIEGVLTDITERRRMLDELTRMATTDYLSGIYNRRYFLELFDREFKRTVRYRLQLSFLLFDVDLFKNINDTYGHDVGDRVLQTVCRTIAGSLRDIDVFGRLGGEEFGVILPETDPLAALTVAERIRQNIEKISFTSETGKLFHTSISVGVSAFTEKEKNVDEVMKAADIALYCAKESGRNRVILYEASLRGA